MNEGHKKFEKQTLNFEQLKERALRLLSRRDHSAYELKAKLKQRIKINDEEFVGLLEFLKDLGYMANESDLSSRWVRQWRSEGRGRRWIEGKLKTKGLPLPNLSDDDEELEAARYFLNKKLGSKNGGRLGYNDRVKLYRSLVSRGFSSSVVATLLNGMGKA